MPEISTPYGKVNSSYNTTDPSKEPMNGQYKSENYRAKNYAYQRDLKKWIAHVLGETPENMNHNFNRNFDPKFRKAYKKAYGVEYEPYGTAIKTDWTYNETPVAKKRNTRNNQTRGNIFNQQLASVRQNEKENTFNEQLASKGGKRRKTRKVRKGRKGTRRA